MKDQADENIKGLFYEIEHAEWKGYPTKISIWAYDLMVSNIVRSKYIFVEKNKIQILFFNYIFGLWMFERGNIS